MPIRLDISPINRMVVIVASGHVTPEEIHSSIQELIAAKVAHYGKIVDVSLATSDLSKDQVEGIAEMLRGGRGSGRGPVAFVVDPNRTGFAQDFSHSTQDDRPVALFRTLRDARTWLAGRSKIEPLKLISPAKGEDD